MEQTEISIIPPPNSGHSPSIKFIQELNIQMAKTNMQFFYDHITDDITWNILTVKRLKGKDNVIEMMESNGKLPVIELKLESIICNDLVGAVNGAVTLDNQDRYAYCSIYTFTSSCQPLKIKEMTTYFQRLII
ncbi:hypothetical protein [Ureibacillus acetophenoni]|uniref:Uncharacterized protein n=1 Tax=Ureibacillus acetophenoni TaxID=614649 RepID=A0A285U3F4_9BACL|nr:hypothetical protein [Ureibacillus acetophenoni]SOC35948.1 hypothetical protein SAMN05877842_10223 [Ureibacillus acetophenoni]